MATFLDALADLVTDPVARAAYRLDPASWLHGHDAGDLCGADVAAAEPVLRRWFPDALLPAALVPAVGADESDLDSAVRGIDHLLSDLPPDDRASHATALDDGPPERPADVSSADAADHR